MIEPQAADRKGTYDFGVGPFRKAGKALDLLRQECGLTVAEVGERWPNGRRSSSSVSSYHANPTAETIDDYLTALGKRPADLFRALDRFDPGNEVREPPAGEDPLDTLAEAVSSSIRELVSEVKAREQRR